MLKSNDLRKGRTCIFLLHAHLVFVTKYRKRIFTQRILADLAGIFKKVGDDFGAILVKCDGEKNHLHLLVNYPPKVSIAKLVNSLKGVSLRMIRKKNHPSITKHLWGKAL